MKKFLMAASMLCVASAAHAATLTDVTGAVMVNKGEGFVPAVGAVELVPGDKILVGEGGFATVSYDNCAVSLDKPTLHAVAKVAPCDQPVISPVADMTSATTDDDGFPFLPVLLVGGTVAAVVIATQVLDEEDDPATPTGAQPAVN